MGNKVQIILSGGSKTKKELREFYISNGIDFFVGYGMTELGFLSLSSSDINDIDSEGSVYPMYDYRILDDGDNILPDGEGELIVDTKGLFSRILYRGELKELELFGGKFFRTGDIFILQDGELFFKGRKKNIIVSKNGENIFIEDIESKLEILKQNNILY
ncbi:AMP-binding protein, partial [Streptococcus agalactiae]|uniref:AMP-binding protein n=1 Tax=Streptococcus agalactiae TaxID=1311 RepID=UPI002003EA19